MLDSSFQFELETDSDAHETYDMTLKRDSHWSTSNRRVLVVMQTVDSRDLKRQEMLGDRGTRQAFINCLKYTKKTANQHLKDRELPEYACAVVNFNNYPHLKMDRMRRAEAENVFAARMHKMIQKLKPTHVLVSGDEAFRALYPSIQHPQYKRGWIHTLKSGQHEYKATGTLDFSRLLEKDGERANLLGFWTRHFAYLLLGRNPHDLSHIQPNVKYINTLEKFDQAMALFDKAEHVGVDTETRNLSVLHNKIYTIQFCFSQDESLGYVLAVDHPLCHWTKEERLYIKKGLRKRFAKKTGPMLITFNGMFDLRVIRQCLKIIFIWLKVWEITFGEHLLDENYTELHQVTYMRDDAANDKSKYGGLRPIFCAYGNDFYFRAKFSKEERATTGTVDPADKEFLKYAGMDVLSITAMMHQQIRRASFKRISGKNYKEFFVRHMLQQMSPTAHVLSHMRSDGSLVSRSYIKYLMSNDSPLRKEISRTAGEFRVYKEVKDVNADLVKNSGFKAGSLFSKKVDTWMFRLGKSDHKKKLFIDRLGLEPLALTKTKEPQIDKAFIAHYKDKNKIIGLYGEYQALFKLMSTYVKGFYKKITTNLDAATDDHLRPDYFPIDTGRLASKNPNLQQIPSRGKLAKIIKRMFVARKGQLLVRYDYSAHEVRVWSIIAGDKVLAEAFRAGQKLRQAFIQDPSEENKKAIKAKGDIHILNVLRFFGKLVDKDDPLRDAVKAVVFGVLYGKGADTLGRDTKKGDLDALKAEISKMYDESLTCKDKKRLAEVNRILEELDLKLTVLMEEDRSEYAQGIIDKMFQEFKAGARWTEKMQKMAEEEAMVYSSNGRIRHLYAALVGDRKVVAKQVRRGSNAPVQGLASEIGVSAAHLILETYYKHLPEFKKMLGLDDVPDWDLRVSFSRAVHDANYFSVPYCMVIPFIHILQYQATYGVTERYETEFNMDFTIEPEVEVEVGVQDANTFKWDWSIPSLIRSFEQSLLEGQALNLLEGQPTEILETLTKPWRKVAMRSYLQEHFPLLGVSDLKEQISKGVKTAKIPDENPYLEKEKA